jgi:hypothetical protein
MVVGGDTTIKRITVKMVNKAVIGFIRFPWGGEPCRLSQNFTKIIEGSQNLRV